MVALILGYALPFMPLLKVSYFERSFGVFNFLQKRTKTSLIVVKLNSFVHFLEETSACKNHFDFVWPLVCLNFGTEVLGPKLPMMEKWTRFLWWKGKKLGNNDFTYHAVQCSTLIAIPRGSTNPAKSQYFGFITISL